MAEIHGTVAPGFEAVRTAFETNFETQGDVGASVAITVGGEFVVDLWGGTATFDGPDDDDAGVPGVEGDWQEDTIINVWSTTKTMAALCCLILADRGELDLYEPIATYWPEFAAGGKEHVATRHVLSHTAGLSGWDEPLTMFDLLDHDKLVRAPRRAGAVVGARLAVRLPRDQPGLPARRDRQARRRAQPRHVLRRRDRRPARRRLPHRHAGILRCPSRAA